jgi:hypothetical protein
MLAEQLAQAASTFADTDPELARILSEAAEALEAEAMDEAAQALGNAAEILDARGADQQMAAAARAAAETLAEARQSVVAAGSDAMGDGETVSSSDALTDSSQDGAAIAGSASDEQGAAGTGGSLVTDDGQEGTDGDTASGGPGAGGGHVESVFIPSPVTIGEENGTAVELPANCEADPAACGPLVGEAPSAITKEASAVPYSEVFADYRDAAYRSLEAEAIPLSLKSLVRDYFIALEP